MQLHPRNHTRAAFVKYRNIIYCNDSVKDHRRYKKKGTLLKLDLEKAYDYTDREVLDYLMAYKGYLHQIALLYNGCLVSLYFSFL